MGSPLQCRVYVDASLALAFSHFVSYGIFYPSSPLTPKYTIAFPVKIITMKAPSLNPKL